MFTCWILSNAIESFFLLNTPLCTTNSCFSSSKKKVKFLYLRYAITARAIRTTSITSKKISNLLIFIRNKKIANGTHIALTNFCSESANITTIPTTDCLCGLSKFSGFIFLGFLFVILRHNWVSPFFFSV